MSINTLHKGDDDDDDDDDDKNNNNDNRSRNVRSAGSLMRCLDILVQCCLVEPQNSWCSETQSDLSRNWFCTLALWVFLQSLKANAGARVNASVQIITSLDKKPLDRQLYYVCDRKAENRSNLLLPYGTGLRVAQDSHINPYPANVENRVSS